MANHAILSPSGAHRWMSCPGAPAMEQDEPDNGSEYADEGTAAHFLAAECLRNNCDPVNYTKRVIEVGCCQDPDFDGALWGGEMKESRWELRNTYEVDGDLIANIRTYVSNIRQYAEGGTLLVEQALPIGHLTGEEDATGTGDAVVLLDDELQLHDLKYGHRGVSPENNPQLMLYALGALKAAEILGYEFARVRLVIHQPRVDSAPREWDCSVAELDAFAAKVRERAFHAMQCFNEKPEALIHHLRPSETACEWCRAKAACPKLADFVQQTVAAEFETMVEPQNGEDVTNEVQALASGELAVKMQACNLIEAWIKAVRAKVESSLLAGTPVPGYKLVQGKRGNRQWRSSDEAEQLLKSFRLKQEEMYDFSLISPTTAEKVLKESPKRWTKAQALIVQKEGKPSVAPADDKRPEWKPEPPKFDNLATGEDLL